jgi:hypothetical protein
MAENTNTSSVRLPRVLGMTARAGVIVLGVGLLAISSQTALPHFQSSAPSVTVSPQSGNLTLVCAGQYLVMGRDAASPLKLDGVGTVRLRHSDEPHELSQLATPGLAVTSAPSVITAPVGDQTPLGLAGAQSSLLNESDAYGLAAAACRPPAFESWLVGGTTSVGASDVLVIANPGAVASTVAVTVYGAAGASTSSVFVAPRSQVAVPLAAHAGRGSSPVVHLSAAGSRVHALLQSNYVRTLYPAGAAWQDTAAEPQTRQVIPGVQLVATELEESAVRVRMMTTQADGQATVRVYTADADATLVFEQSVQLVAQQPLELGLAAVELGVYTVTVDSDTPLVAAAWQAVGTVEFSDFAWMPSASLIESETTFTVPPGPDPRLHIVNDEASPLSVSLLDVQGISTTHVIGAHASLLLPVTAGTSYAVTPEAPARVALLFAGETTIAGWTLWPEAASRGAITVYP